MIFSVLGEMGEISATLAMSPYELILQPDNKPRRSQYVHTFNFTFLGSHAAVVASFEVPRLASHCIVFPKHSPREASRRTSKLAFNAIFERENVKSEVCTCCERRGLLSGCKTCSYGDMMRVMRISSNSLMLFKIMISPPPLPYHRTSRFYRQTTNPGVPSMFTLRILQFRAQIRPWVPDTKCADPARTFGSI